MTRHRFPDAYFGSTSSEPIDWRKDKIKEAPDDDRRLAQTPPDVVAMLGFDPNDFYASKPVDAGEKVKQFLRRHRKARGALP